MAKSKYRRSKAPNIIVEDLHLEAKETLIIPDATALVEADQPDRAIGFKDEIAGYFMAGVFNPFGDGGNQVKFDQFFGGDLVQPDGVEGQTYLPYPISLGYDIGPSKLPLSMVVFDYSNTTFYKYKTYYPSVESGNASGEERIYDKFILNPDGTVFTQQIIVIAYVNPVIAIPE